MTISGPLAATWMGPKMIIQSISPLKPSTFPVAEWFEEGRESDIQKEEWWSLFFSLELETRSFAGIDECGSEVGKI